MRILDLRYNTLRELPSEVFAGLSKLQWLFLFFNKLNELPAEVWGNLFAGLSNLQGLSLGWNKLGDLPAAVWAHLFAELRNLRWLDLSGNDLSELPAEAFSALGNLRKLVLNSCTLNVKSGPICLQGSTSYRSLICHLTTSTSCRQFVQL